MAIDAIRARQTLAADMGMGSACSFAEVGCADNSSGNSEQQEAIAAAGPMHARGQTAAEEATDESLYEALRQSEGEALQQEQSQIQEAVLLSKLVKDSLLKGLKDPMENSMDDMSLVLLSFQRFPKEFCLALLGSPLAAHLVAKGVKTQPSWAFPRLVLAHGVDEHSVTEDRGWWHVCVRAIDEDVVQAIRLALHPEVRPLMKDRFVVPIGDSLFDASSAQDSSGEATGTYVSVCPGPSWRELTIKNTFLDAPKESASSVSRARSAPP